MIQCVIFDCDGTLVDSEFLCSVGLELQLQDCGVRETADDLFHAFKGWKLASICEALENKHSIRLPSAFVDDYRRRVEMLFDEKLRPIKGIEQVLAQIPLPMCVASSGPPEKIEHALQLTGLKPYFGERVFSSYLIQSWKPDPGLFLHAAKMMGFPPSACAVVEDSEVGIHAALNAGMQAFWFTDKDQTVSFQNVPRFADMLDLPGLLRCPRGTV